MGNVVRLFGFFVLVALCSLANPAFSQCINGLPCIEEDQFETANPPKSDHGSCSADFMNQIYARAALEAEREVMMASVAIKKPDSVLEYTCFDQLAYKSFVDAKKIFSGKQFAYQRPSYKPPEGGDFANTGDAVPAAGEDIDRSGDPSATNIPESGGTYSRTGKVSIDYDGSPTAYHPSDSIGDDYLENAGRPGRWWGIVTTNGQMSGTPYVQTSGPYAGYYVSTTSWANPSRDRLDYRRYVNAEVIPYVAMTSGDRSRGMRHGDFVLLTNTSNGRQIWAVIADYAGYRADPHAELSPEAARLLGISFTRRGVGSSSQVRQEFFQGSRIPGFFPEGSAGRARVLAGPDSSMATPRPSSGDSSPETPPLLASSSGASSASASSAASTTTITSPSVTATGAAGDTGPAGAQGAPSDAGTPDDGIDDSVDESIFGAGGSILPVMGGDAGSDSFSDIEGDLPSGLPGDDVVIPDVPSTSSDVPVNTPPVVAPTATGYERWVAMVTKEFESVEILTIPAFNDYLKTNFSHRFLGRTGMSRDMGVVDDYMIGQYKRSNYQCPMMDMAHTLAKCTDFGDDYHQFFSFQDLVSILPRSMPSRYSCGGNSISQGLVDLAEDKALRNIDSSEPDPTPDECGAPIDTGLNYTHSDIRLDNRGRVSVGDTKPYDHKICAKSFCVYDRYEDECVKKAEE